MKSREERNKKKFFIKNRLDVKHPSGAENDCIFGKERMTAFIGKTLLSFNWTWTNIDWTLHNFGFAELWLEFTKFWLKCTDFWLFLFKFNWILTEFHWLLTKLYWILTDFCSNLTEFQLKFTKFWLNFTEFWMNFTVFRQKLHKNYQVNFAVFPFPIFCLLNSFDCIKPSPSSHSLQIKRKTRSSWEKWKVRIVFIVIIAKQHKTKGEKKEWEVIFVKV